MIWKRDCVIGFEQSLYLDRGFVAGLFLATPISMASWAAVSEQALVRDDFCPHLRNNIRLLWGFRVFVLFRVDQTCCRRARSWAPPPAPRHHMLIALSSFANQQWGVRMTEDIQNDRPGLFWLNIKVFYRCYICFPKFTKMNSFCQCAPSLRLLEWMGSCIQVPSSCNEQDGVQSLFHLGFFSDWERQLSSIGWVTVGHARLISSRRCDDICIKIEKRLLKAVLILLVQCILRCNTCILDRGWGENAVYHQSQHENKGIKCVW